MKPKYPKDTPPMSVALNEMSERYPEYEVESLRDFKNGITCVKLYPNKTRFVGPTGRVFPDDFLSRGEE